MGTVKYNQLQDAARLILDAIGQDPDAESVKDTPRRFADLWAAFIDYDPGTLTTAFEAKHVDQMVVVSGMRVWSVCAHHLLPFWCDITVAYITSGKMLGLSKFGRIAQSRAHRLQVQEELIGGIADDVQAITDAKSVAVIGTGEHLCFSMRGAQMPHRMSSSVTRGLFRTDVAARAELFALIDQASR